MQFRRRLPSMTALLTLEAVLRRRSFTAAASELGVTQAAVSRQIAALEEELGQPLFWRRHRAIEPTPACLALGASLVQSFTNIVETIDTLKAGNDEIVTLGATVAVSSFWLLPRLSDFRRLHPSIHVRVVSQDTRINLDEGDVDIAIRYGTPPFSDAAVIASRGDVIFPICSPDYLARRVEGPLSHADELIEAEVTDRSWYSWSQWLSTSHGQFVAKPSLRFNHYTEAIAAARSGQGVAIGWGLLVENFIADHTLVQLGDEELVASDSYHVIVPRKKRPTSRARDQAIEWLAASLAV